MKINNRRYIGNKFKLLEFIYDSIAVFGCDNKSIFFDIFAGTGVVANYFAEKGYKTILNDNLYSNFVVYNAFLGAEALDEKKLETIIKNIIN